MNRTQQAQADVRRSRNAIEYYSHPSLLAQRYWHYALVVGINAKVPTDLVHGHQDEAKFLLHYIHRGEMWHTVENRTYRASQGSVCLMSLDKQVRYGVEGDAATDLWWALLGGHDMPDLFLELKAHQDPVFRLTDVPRFERLFRDLIDLMRRRPPMYHALSDGVLSAMLANLFIARGVREDNMVLIQPTGTQVVRISSLSEAVLNAIHYIEHCCHESISLEMLSTEAGISMHYFVQLFHRETGLSPMRYLTRYRIEKAKELLSTTHHPIREIARMVGMPDPCTFARTFQKLTGHTPSLYRSEQLSKQAFVR